MVRNARASNQMKPSIATTAHASQPLLESARRCRKTWNEKCLFCEMTAHILNSAMPNDKKIQMMVLRREPVFGGVATGQDTPMSSDVVGSSTEGSARMVASPSVRTPTGSKTPSNAWASAASCCARRFANRLRYRREPEDVSVRLLLRFFISCSFL